LRESEKIFVHAAMELEKDNKAEIIKAMLAGRRL